MTQTATDAAETQVPQNTVEVPDTQAPQTEEQGSFAKAGKRSKKQMEEAQAEADRQARKATFSSQAAPVKKGATPVTRPKLERRSKQYQAAHKLIDRSKTYSLAEAIDLAVKTSATKFASTVEAHVRLGVDPRQADQNIRTTIVLPKGNGKTVRVAVFAPLDLCKTAQAAGADLAADEDLITQLEKGTIDFDMLIATPQYMPKLGKFARLLGPRGLMPNPKAGTVTNDVAKAVKEAKAGKVEYRVDKQAIVHLGLGKTDFAPADLLANAEAFFSSLQAQKPASLKNTYIKSIYLSTTMGPSIPVTNSYN